MVMDGLMNWSDDSKEEGLSHTELERLRIDALRSHDARSYAFYSSELGISEDSLEDVNLYKQGMCELTTVDEAAFKPIRVQLPPSFDIRSEFGGLVEKIVDLTARNGTVNVSFSITKRPSAGGVDVTANYTLGGSTSTVFLSNYDDDREADSSGFSAARSYLMGIFPGSTVNGNKIIVRGKYTLDNFL